MDFNVPKVGFRAMSEYMSRRGVCIHGPNGLSVPPAHPLTGPILGHMEEIAKSLELRPHVSVTDPPASGGSRPLQSGARYVQSRPPLGLSSIGCGLSHSPCAGMRTHVPVVVGPNSPLGSLTMAHGPLTRVLVGNWDGRVRRQGYGRPCNDSGRELAGLWSIRCSIIFAFISTS